MTFWEAFPWKHSLLYRLDSDGDGEAVVSEQTDCGEVIGQVGWVHAVMVVVEGCSSGNLGDYSMLLPNWRTEAGKRKRTPNISAGAPSDLSKKTYN